jgi:hypothetical protein
MEMKRLVQVKLHSFTEYSMDKVPKGLVEFADWLHAMSKIVPEAHRDNARIEFDLEAGEDATPQVSMYYTRPETDEEEAERMRQHEEHRRSVDMYNEARDRAEYERLKRKYGG